MVLYKTREMVKMPVRANKHCQEISTRILELRQYIYANANREHAVKQKDMIA